MTGFAKARALIVGIADYQSITPLPASVRRDATDLQATLTDPAISGYDPTTVTLLLNCNATAAAIRAELDRAAAEMQPDEVFLFFFSGHGTRVQSRATLHAALAPFETDPFDLQGTAFRDDDLLALLEALPAERQVIILDACHSGGVGTLKSADGTAAKLPPASAFNDLGSGRGRVLLCSSRADEVSLAPPSLQNSLFTHLLLEGLKGASLDRGDGVVRVFDLFEYVSREVPKRASQHPIFKADNLEENFAIARRPAAKSPAAATNTGPVPPAEQIEAAFRTLYPLGPLHDRIWQRAGGDLSRLEISGTGASQWHGAIRAVLLGGGGLTLATLLDAAAADYPLNETIAALRKLV